MPLPEAYGEKRRTSQAATKAAAAPATTTSTKPRTASPCAQAISRSRNVSARSSTSLNTAPINPAAAPTTSASTASVSSLPWSFSAQDGPAILVLVRRQGIAQPCRRRAPQHHGLGHALQRDLC